MRTVLQRVSEASVSIGGTTVGSIGRGLLILLGIEPADTEADADWLVKKAAALRIFDDEEGVMNRSVADVGGRIRRPRFGGMFCRNGRRGDVRRHRRKEN